MWSPSNDSPYASSPCAPGSKDSRLTPRDRHVSPPRSRRSSVRARRGDVRAHPSSTTLLDPEVNFLQFLDAFEIVRLLSKQQRGENLLHDRADRRKGQTGFCAAAHPFAL